jgi:hypothetical protein
MWAIYLNGAIVVECDVDPDDDFLWMFAAGYFIIA